MEGVGTAITTEELSISSTGSAIIVVLLRTGISKHEEMDALGDDLMDMDSCSRIRWRGECLVWNQ